MVSTAAAQPSVRPQVVASGLQHPWALAFLPQGRFLVSERPGDMRIIAADGRVGPALAGLPEIAARGQGGLLDLVLDEDFARNRTLFFCFSEPGAGGNSTALARACLSVDETLLTSTIGRTLLMAAPNTSSGSLPPLVVIISNAP